MKNNWEILQKELTINNIKLFDDCTCEHVDSSGKKVRVPIRYKTRMINKAIKRNIIILESLFLDLLELLRLPPIGLRSDTIDVKNCNLFINCLQGLMDFAIYLLDDYSTVFNTLKEQEIKTDIQNALNRDLTTFNKDVILLIPGYKFSVDWIHRLIRHLIYMHKLLVFAAKGQPVIENSMAKFARGVQGPWAHLDLPLKERVFDWTDIEEEVRGRDRDIRKQRRYRMGLENYHGDGRVSEGFYWRELRNEPFSWYNRSYDDPYPGRHILTRY